MLCPLVGTGKCSWCFHFSWVPQNADSTVLRFWSGFALTSSPVSSNSEQNAGGAPAGFVTDYKLTGRFQDHVSIVQVNIMLMFRSEPVGGVLFKHFAGFSWPTQCAVCKLMWSIIDQDSISLPASGPLQCTSGDYFHWLEWRQFKATVMFQWTFYVCTVYCYFLFFSFFLFNNCCSRLLPVSTRTLLSFSPWLINK